MASAVTWLGALTRLQLRNLCRGHRGTRVPILRCLPPPPARSWQTPELRLVELPQRIEFAFRVPGAVADATRVYWNEDAQILTVHVGAAGLKRNSADDTDWYTEVSV